MTLEEKRRQQYPVFQDAVQRVQQGQRVMPFYDNYINTLILSAGRGISNRQLLINFIKWMHDFNVMDVDLDMAKLTGELSEAMEARAEHNDEQFIQELADVVIYCYGIAQMLRFDLDTVIEQKIAYNFQRNYQQEQ